MEITGLIAFLALILALVGLVLVRRNNIKITTVHGAVKEVANAVKAQQHEVKMKVQNRSTVKKPKI